MNLGTVTVITMRYVPDVLILTAPYFDEIDLVTCLVGVRQAGLTTHLIGATPGKLNGHRGVCLFPDKLLLEMSEQQLKPKQMVVVAGGYESAAVVLANPYAHQLIQQVLDNAGYIVGLRGTQQLLVESNLPLLQNSCHWLQQEQGEETAVFVQRLLDFRQ